MKYYYVLFLFFFSSIAFGQWENLNTGINDNLNGIVFFNEDLGLVSGEHGLYYTTNGGVGSSNWHRFTISNNTASATLYENTKFNTCMRYDQNDIIAVGEDVVQHKAVIMRISLPSLNYVIQSINVNNSSLVDLETYIAGHIMAVGNNGLLVKFTNVITDYTIVNTGITDDFRCIERYDSSEFYIGCQNKFFVRDNNNAIYLEEVPTPGITHNDFIYNGCSTSYSVGNKYVRYSSLQGQELNNYDYGPLNGNVITWCSNENYVGTDHGIFKTASNKNILEYQPSSNSYNIKNIFNLYSSNILYACGTNGVVLKNIDPGNEAQPFVRITSEGGCLSQFSIRLSSFVGTTTSCQWYVDNSFESSRCGDFYYNFPSVGTYEIKLVANNNGLVSEATKTFHVVSQPIIDKPYTMDNILCHEESVQITINDSEPDVIYSLYKINSTHYPYGTSAVGNGGAVTLNTVPINETGTFYLSASNINAPSCEKRFSNTFDIIVEHTSADFHTDLINAYVNEDVIFHQQTQEASIFDWSFIDANIATSTDENPINTYNTTGIHDVSLYVSSSDGCTDDITLQSPNIITEPIGTQQCWSYMNIRGILPWPGSYNNDILHITKVTGGYLTGGYFKNEIFGTNHGEQVLMDNQEGGFLTKHDFKGTLKWLVKTNHSILASVEDLQGNIYVAFKASAGDIFYDNAGNKISLQSRGYIIKLNAKGKYIWDLSIRTYIPDNLYIDNNNDLIISGNYDIYNDSDHFVYLNDIQTGEVGTIHYGGASRNANGIIKVNPDGAMFWDNKIIGGRGISPSIEASHIGIDADNNYYVQGTYNNNMLIYHTNPNYYTELISHASNNNGKDYSYLYKLNSDGELQWADRMYAVEDNDYFNISIYDAKTDKYGNTYLTGTNHHQLSTSDQVHTIDNANGTIFSSNITKTYFLSKINTNGNTEWHTGVTEPNTSIPALTNGFELDIHNNSIYVLGRVNDDIDINQNIIFQSVSGNSLTVPLMKDKIFIGKYAYNGNLSSISLFEETYDPTKIGNSTDFFVYNANEYYYSTNIDTGTAKNGRINYFNSNCATLNESVVLSSTATAENNYICSTVSTTLHANAVGGEEIYTYSWTSIPSGFISSEPNPVVSPDVDTEYFVEVNDGLNIVSSSVTINVTDIPNVSLSAFQTVHINDPGFLLTGGLPAGGVYSGNGVEYGVFYPNIAGVGSHIITYTYTVATGCEYTATQVIEVENSSSINNLSNTISINIYPNPSKGNFFVDINTNKNKKIELTIINQLGAIIYNESFFINGKIHKKIDLTHFSNGIYYIKLNDGNNQYLRKIGMSH